MGVLQGPGHGHRHVGREIHVELAAPHQLGQVLPIDILDKEVAIQIAGIVDAHYPRIHGRQVRLQHRPAAFRFDGVARIGVGALLNQLQGHRLTQRGIVRQVHIGHTAAAEFLADLILAEFARSRRDHFLPPACLPPPARGASSRKFRSLTNFRSVPAGRSREFFSITLPISAGLAPSRAAIPAPLFR